MTSTSDSTSIEVDIRPCQAGDLALLEEAIPTGPSRFHERRFRLQQQRKAVYLIAWHGERPVGHLCLRWSGSGSKSVQRHLTGCPELNAIGVVPELRSRRIGRRLITQAEELIRERGFAQAGLAVAVDNPRARTLYERLGYRDWGHGDFDGGWRQLDDDGEEIFVHERDSYLIKDLAA